VSSGHGRTLRRYGGACAWRSVVFLVSVLLLCGQPLSVHWQIVVSWGLQTALFGLLLFQIKDVARQPTLPEPTRRFWATLPLTAMFSLGTDGVPFLQTLGSHGTGGAVAGVAHEVFGTLATLVLVWACLTYRWSGDSRRRQLRRWLDAASLLIAGLGVLWYFEAGTLQREHLGPTAVAGTIVLEAVGLVTILAFLQPLTSDIRPIVRGTAVIVIVAVVFGTVVDAILPAAIHTSWLRLLLVLRVAPAALACLAVRYQRSRLEVPSKSAKRSRRIYSRLPYLCVTATYVLFGLALKLSQADARTWGMYAAACGVTSLVVVRQLTAMSDNAQLVRDLTRSVTRADQLAEELHHHAFYDGLTELPNRMLFADRLAHSLVQRKRSQTPLAVMVVDLDDFKLVNDRCGHEAGDLVLQEAAGRLTESLRAGDTVARLGGDEFAVLVHGADNDGLRTVAARIVAAFETPFLVADGLADLGISVGVVVVDDDNADTATLLRHADIAMYVAKAGGKRRYDVFQPSMLDKLVNRHDSKQALLRALSERELVVHYQPIVDAVDGQVRGVEALVRWMRPGHGMVPPLDFLSLAEQFGLIPDIDLFVLRTACQQVQQWNDVRALSAQFTVHVNMSAVTLALPDVVTQVEDALRRSGLPARHLAVELTESTLMADPPAVIARMRALRQTGVKLAIDDFGTGYSSLAYLRDLPVDTVKVDKSFVDRIVGEEIDRELVRTIVNLAGRLGLDTVAEGVEGQDQAALLSALGCGRMQGYLFARPTPAEQLVETGDRVGRDTGWLAQAALLSSDSSPAALVPAPR
jgi:diguanylate cyclase (GGDEF)-like protein